MTGEQLIVQKYGGSSLSSLPRICDVADKIARRAKENTQLVVAVSAMGQSTDDLLRLAFEITPQPPQRELDMLLTVGERVSMALLSMALHEAGCSAISFTGSQSGIVTNVSHTRALIEYIRPERIRNELSRGKVVIVAGFQGVSLEKEITTLGRGGSDTTAVAIAAALQATCCEIYSDYPGVFNADPRWVESARVVSTINYDEMLELATLGARVLHYRAAEIARRYGVQLRLLSSFDEAAPGTTVQDNVSMEKTTITSITYNAKIAFVRFTTSRGTDALVDILDKIRHLELPIITYHKEYSGPGSTLSIVVDRSDHETLRNTLTSPREEHFTMESREDLASVSVIGSGFACNVGAILRIEQLLRDANIPVTCVMNSSLSVTCVVPETECKKAVNTLHGSLFEKSEAQQSP